MKIDLQAAVAYLQEMEHIQRDIAAAHLKAGGGGNYAVAVERDQQADMIRFAIRELQTDQLASMRSRVMSWLRTTFSAAALTDRWERASRVIEEAAELAQAEGLSEADVIRTVKRTFSRPVGEASQEAAGLMVTLLAWAGAAMVDLGAVTRKEIDRIEMPENVAAIRAKQAEKAEAGVGRNYAEALRVIKPKVEEPKEAPARSCDLCAGAGSCMGMCE